MTTTIATIAEHSVDISLLPKNFANILDLGCRGFEFTKFFRSAGCNVFPVDCDDLFPGDYYKVAITNFNGFTDVYKSKDAQATRINVKHEKESSFLVMANTLDSFSKRVGVSFWDLIKFDIEGSEREVIMFMTGPPARQVSIEFHLHTGVYSMNEVDQMVDKLHSLGYYPAKHELTKQHGSGLNFWDSLWILK